MKLVIDISAEDFEKVKCGRGAVSMMRKAIIHGTPLPEDAEILTKEAYSDLCRRAANVPNFESEEYIEQRLEGYDKLLKSGVLDCVKYSSTPNGDSSTDSTTVELEKCGDCISREEIKQKFQWLEKATKYGNEDAEQQNFSYSTMMMYEIADMIEDAIDSCKSVEPERKPGKWIRGEAYPHHIYCSECYKTFIPNDELRIWTNGDLPRRYCPNCGATMEVDG